MDQSAGSPAGMGSVQLAHPSLDLTGELSGVVMRAMRPVSQPRQAFLPVATQPRMHRLAGYPIALGDLNNGNPAADDLHDGVITLLHNAQLHEHQPGPLHTTPVARSRPEDGMVTHHLKPAVTHQPESDRIRADPP
jgi:hypothetical protein